MIDPKIGKPFQLDSTDLKIQIPTKHGYAIKDTTQKMTGSINDDRYKNLPLNCEYEFIKCLIYAISYNVYYVK